MKKVLLKLHLYLGLVFGVIIAVIGVSGAFISYQSEILEVLNKSSIKVVPQTTTISLDKMALNVQKLYPNSPITGVYVYSDKSRSVRFSVAVEPGKRGIKNVFVNPYNGEILPQYRYQGFFNFMLNVHKRLSLGGAGREVVAVSTVLLIFFSISGVILYYKALKYNFIKAMKIPLKGSLHALSYKWHCALGIWFLVPILLMCLTGLYWSYDWYRSGFLKVLNYERVVKKRVVSAPKVSQISGLDTVFDEFGKKFEYESAWVRFPLNLTNQEISFYKKGYTHIRQTNLVRIDAKNGEILSQNLYEEKPLNAKFASSVLPLHSGEFFGEIGKFIFMVASFLMALFGATGYILWFKKHKKKAKKVKA
ncbi:PepSY-associated TM helix domain-containing protein [Campylobacter geochelonis]|uniref:Putative bifunctional protein: sulfite reductase [NADPH] flavoprotein alpha-component; iron-uptake factor n=1 Tax=Campylobacter geochelonis TaxID=1780362 RepID=A0A128EKZ9_9BACT|nr:PepSY-associated TM helix domain-containing protein [Campylobacter geochelonis]QKF72118.1 PepSY domain-containing membrane protein [Campylobacter geochelonis]CZE45934.1 putative bifunctional protein: sulfite reductase [NADPH] flavoprotein alpha-component%3B iron-uptake factor [Campylobacter geochelonis]CZE46698.1 putative bifunctional protein: sulfite reductase [NADPH] flavoprotein alpha-component%3B iron-uptake factor [Campylobacter geochelonis]CZE49796.1 putative bifunctional protein: sulf